MTRETLKKRNLSGLFSGSTINMGKYFTETKDYYECTRCNITTATEFRLCPCNRKPCDATKKGTMTITKNITFDNENRVISRQLDSDDLGQMIASMNL